MDRRHDLAHVALSLVYPALIFVSISELSFADLRANHADVLKGIRDSRDFSDDSKKALVAALDKFVKTFA